MQQHIQELEYFKNIDIQHAVDPLTQVLTRETLLGYAQHLIDSKKEFTFCMVDIDNFKYVNDKYGHITGDNILVTIAKHLMDTIGKQGVVGRFGGDEFLIIINNITEYSDVWNIFHHLNATMKGLEFEEAKELRATLTTGLSRYPLDARTLDKLIEKADRALYRGKTKGRNCFIIYLNEKHKNLPYTKQSILTTIDVHQKCFELLTATCNIENNIRSLFQFVCEYLMLDHICIQKDEQLAYSTCHPLANCELIDSLPITVVKNAVKDKILYTNDIDTIKKCHPDLYSTLKEQKISSTCLIAIDVFGKHYGYLRVDTTKNGRIWQSADLNYLIAIANTIALLLYGKENK